MRLTNKLLPLFLFVTIYGCFSAQKLVTNEDIIAEGLPIYERECLACHMRDGRGVPGMTPGLFNSSWLAGPKESLIAYILTGGFGPQVQMARFDFLSDDEIAKVLTYSKFVYSGERAIITTELVKDIRVEIDSIK